MRRCHRMLMRFQQEAGTHVSQSRDSDSCGGARLTHARDARGLALAVAVMAREHEKSVV